MYIDKSQIVRDLFVFTANGRMINRAVSTGISLLLAAICHPLRFSQLVRLAL